jgi:hypothetical protein
MMDGLFTYPPFTLPGLFWLEGTAYQTAIFIWLFSHGTARVAFFDHQASKQASKESHEVSIKAFFIFYYSALMAG